MQPERTSRMQRVAPEVPMASCTAARIRTASASSQSCRMSRSRYTSPLPRAFGSVSVPPSTWNPRQASVVQHARNVPPMGLPYTGVHAFCDLACTKSLRVPLPHHVRTLPRWYPHDTCADFLVQGTLDRYNHLAMPRVAWTPPQGTCSL